MRIKVLFLLILSLFCINPVFSAAEKSVIRVAISNKSGFEYSNVRLYSTSPISIISMSKASSNAQIGTVEPEKVIEVQFKDCLYNIYIYGSL